MMLALLLLLDPVMQRAYERISNMRACDRVVVFNYQAPCNASSRNANITQALQACRPTQNEPSRSSLEHRLRDQEHMWVCYLQPDSIEASTSCRGYVACTGLTGNATCAQGVRLVYYNSRSNLLLLEIGSIPQSYQPAYLGKGYHIQPCPSAEIARFDVLCNAAIDITARQVYLVHGMSAFPCLLCPAG